MPLRLYFLYPLIFACYMRLRVNEWEIVPWTTKWLIHT
jgi:hypothetical protein